MVKHINGMRINLNGKKINRKDNMQEERRLDYPEIKERLAVLETLQIKDINDAIEWRKVFCNKLDEVKQSVVSIDKSNTLLMFNINSKLDKLPCEVTAVKLKEFDVFKGLVFRIIIWGVISLLAVSVAWGAMQMRVNVDNDRITDIEKIVYKK